MCMIQLEGYLINMHLDLYQAINWALSVGRSTGFYQMHLNLTLIYNCLDAASVLVLL